ncbi:D(2) dopamine receptor-like [Lingula anatina]|uniref:D(2) dopamine receptor-like n=1 Tax=Lingula anatina TaxID=7574 RepID=A0A1S3JTE3_LINAN|nr:D(2) dopamine receptor-like [Lingula anatina]XP_013413635.1 D(2) dopamine receptor-like [Lingula anatina]|eukprot:XP_013413634.1 D(2) dopamine receptor-like [Lingula anatina]
MNNSSLEIMTTSSPTLLPSSGGLVTNRSLPETVIYGILLGVLIVLTILGNVMVLASFVLEKRLRILVNYPIISLALGDLLLGLLVLPFSALLTATQHFPFGAIWCNIYISFDVMLCKASIWNVTAISVDRYIAVTWPLRYRQHISHKKVFAVLLAIWFVAAITAFVPIYMGWNTADGLVQNLGQAEAPSCHLAVENLAYSVTLSLTDFIIPLILLLFTYVQVLVIARRQAQLIQTPRIAFNSHANGPELPTLNTKELRATIMLSAVIATFLLCWILYMVTFIIKPFIPHLDNDLDLTALWLGYLNSTANPFVYAVAHPKFRRTFMRILCPKWLCKCAKHQRNSDSPDSNFNAQNARLCGPETSMIDVACISFQS